MKVIFNIIGNAVVFLIFAAVVGDLDAFWACVGGLLAAYLLLLVAAGPMLSTHVRRYGSLDTMLEPQRLHVGLLGSVFVSAISGLVVLKTADPAYAWAIALGIAGWFLLNHTLHQFLKLKAVAGRNGDAA